MRRHIRDGDRQKTWTYIYSMSERVKVTTTAPSHCLSGFNKITPPRPSSGDLMPAAIYNADSLPWTARLCCDTKDVSDTSTRSLDH